MTTLLDELLFEILVLVPTFEERWSASRTCKQWKSVHRSLLQPKNDARSSQHLKPTWMVIDSESCGPELINWGKNRPPGMMACGFKFAYLGKLLVQLFAVHSPDHIRCHYYGGKRSFDIFREPMGPWKLTYVGKKKMAMGGRSRHTIDVPNPIENGDVFDQVNQAKTAFSFQNASREALDLYPDELEWKDAVCFDPVLARRIYSFPYFVKKREELEAIPLEYVDEG